MTSSQPSVPQLKKNKPNQNKKYIKIITKGNVAYQLWLNFKDLKQ